MSTEINIHPFTTGWEHPDWGRVFIANQDFVTMLTKWPPAALRCADMWSSGWEVYIQPQPFNSTDYEGGGPCFLTTYKRRNLK